MTDSWRKNRGGSVKTGEGKQTDRQTDGRSGDRWVAGGRNGDGQSVDDEKTKVDKLTDGQTDW